MLVVWIGKWVRRDKGTDGNDAREDRKESAVTNIQ